MKFPDRQFSHAATILAVKNVAETAAFYRDQLGFEINFTWENPPSYAVLNSGDVNIHLSQRRDGTKPSTQHTAIYIFVHDVDALYKAYLTRKIEIAEEIATHDYGMRDFTIRDPEGYLITFGKGV